MEEILQSIYYNPASAGSFASAAKLRSAANALGHTYSLSEVNKWLAGQEVYTLSRRSVSKHKWVHGIQSAGLDSRWESDLVVLLQFKDDNDGYCYILMMEDVFSRYLWMKPLRTKRSTEVAAAMEAIFSEGRRPEHALATDKGSEYLGGPTQRLLKSYKINHVLSLEN